MNRFGHDEELVRTILDSFLSESPELMEKISSAVAVRDMDVVREFSHALKGSSANVNAMALTHAALELENSAKNGDSNRLGTLYNNLKSEFETFTKEIAS